MNVYVSRVGGTGPINGIYALAQFPGQQSMQDTDPETIAYLSGLPQPDGGASLAARVAALETKVAAIAALPVVATGLPVVPAAV